MTQALAYPWLYSAVAQLIFNTPGTPRLCFYNVGEELIPVGQASFAQVVETVRRANPDDVVVGFLTKDGTMMITPHMDFVYDFRFEDRIIIFTRRLRSEHGCSFESGGPGQAVGRVWQTKI